MNKNELTLTADDVVEWCKENQAEVTWFRMNGKDFVRLTCQGYVTQNGNFKEAVHYLRWLIGKSNNR